MNKVDLSFIIPVLNEEEHIGGVIDSIKENCDKHYTYEIIIVDNGSIDRTRDIAKSKSSRVFCKPDVSISTLRNAGVAEAQGEIIVFIDADVYLKDTWGKKIGSVLEWLENNPMTITGSTYGLRDNPRWVERYWYEPVLHREEINYINGGHLITTKKLFKKVGGFNKNLETGEDADFCYRAKRIGAKIINNPELEVIHEGYPKTVMNFFQRERWHGRGDYVSLKSIFSSKPAILSLAQCGVMLISLVWAIIHVNPMPLFIYISFMGILCGVSAIFRCGGINLFVPGCIFLYVFYFLARSVAFFDVIFGKPSKYNIAKKVTLL